MCGIAAGGRRWLFFIGLAVGLLIGPGHMSSAAEVAPTDFAVAGAEEGSPGYFAKIFSEARKYKKLYDSTKESYDALRAAYELAYAELRGIDERILLYRGTEEDFQALLEREKEAWLSLYARPQNHSTSANSEKQDPGAVAIVSYLPRFDPGSDPDSSASRWTYWLNRYSIYKSRFEAVTAAHQQLQQATAELQDGLTKARRDLQLAAGTSQDVRSKFSIGRDAWRRLYSE